METRSAGHRKLELNAVVERNSTVSLDPFFNPILRRRKRKKGEIQAPVSFAVMDVSFFFVFVICFCFIFFPFGKKELRLWYIAFQ